MDRKAFIRPIAHRGLHDLARGRIENTAAAFAAALDRGYGAECDLQSASDGTPMVFHDFTLERLIEAAGPIAGRTPAALSGLRYKSVLGGRDQRILLYAEFLDLAAGRGPLLVEIKGDWRRTNRAFLGHIAELSSGYKGPLALMSFDPAIMAAMAELAPRVPRGIVSGLFRGSGWWLERIGLERAYRLSHLLESAPAKPSFYNYNVRSLPTPVTRYVREVERKILYCWTVRSLKERRKAAEWADAPTFEGYEP